MAIQGQGGLEVMHKAQGLIPPDPLLAQGLQTIRDLAGQPLPEPEGEELIRVAKGVGRFLWRAVVPEEVERRIWRPDAPFLLSLDTDSELLHALPWELICSGDSFLVRQGIGEMVRGVLGAAGRKLPSTPRKRLTLLAFLAAPEGRGMAYTEEIQRLCDVLCPLEGRHGTLYPAEVMVADQGTLRDLEGPLRSPHPPRGVHLSCPSDGGGGLTLETDDGGWEELTGDELASRLGDVPALDGRPAFACPDFWVLSSGGSSAGAPSAAMMLFRAGAAAVMGYSSTLPPPLALACEGAFYHSLTNGSTFLSAWAAARAKLVSPKGPFPLAWASPVLFLRGPDQVLVGCGTAAREQRWRYLNERRASLWLGRSAWDFVGRRREIQRGGALLQKHGALAILGPRGIGKTALAARLVERFASGWTTITLTSRCESTDDVLAHLLAHEKEGLFRAPSSQATATDRLVESLTSLIARKRLLLRWEGLEECLAQEGDKTSFRHPWMGPCLRALLTLVGDRFRLLVTSCHSLSDMEHSLTLEPLPFGEARLLYRSLPRLNEIHRGNLVRIHQTVGGHPLALRLLDVLLGERIRGWQHSRITGTVWRVHLGALEGQEAQEEEFREIIAPLLEGLTDKAMAHERFLSHLWTSLSQEERLMLTSAAMGRTPFPWQIFSRLGQKKGNWTASAKRLHSLSLVSRIGEGSLCTIHPSISHLVRSLDWEEATLTLWEAHGTLGMALLDHEGSQEDFEIQLEARRHLVEAEIWPGAAQVTLSLARFFRPYAPWRAMELLREVIGRPDDMFLDWELRLALAEILIDLQRTAEGLEVTGKLLVRLKNSTPSDEEGERAGAILGRSLDVHASLTVQAGRLREARRTYRDALFLYRLLADHDPGRYQSKVAGALGHLGNLLGRLGEENDAKLALKEALKIYRALVDLPRVASTLSHLATLLHGLGELNEAMTAYREALAQYRPLAEVDPHAFQPEVATILHHMGSLYLGAERLDKARQSFTEALEIYRSLADQDLRAFHPSVAMALNSLGGLMRRLGEMEQAASLYQEALGIYTSLAQGDPEAYRPKVAMILNNIGNMLRREGDLDRAREAFQEALDTYRSLVDRQSATYLPKVATTLNNLGNLLDDRGLPAEAQGAYEEALDILRSLEQHAPGAYLVKVATTLNNLGNLLHDSGRRDQARGAYEEALTILHLLDSQDPPSFRANLAMTLHNLGNLLAEMKETERAWPVVEEALVVHAQMAARNPKGMLERLNKSCQVAGELIKDDLSLVEERLRAIWDACLPHGPIIWLRLADFFMDVGQPTLAAEPVGLCFEVLMGLDRELDGEVRMSLERLMGFLGEEQAQQALAQAKDRHSALVAQWRETVKN